MSRIEHCAACTRRAAGAVLFLARQRQRHEHGCERRARPSSNESLFMTPFFSLLSLRLSFRCLSFSTYSAVVHGGLFTPHLFLFSLRLSPYRTRLCLQVAACHIWCLPIPPKPLPLPLPLPRPGGAMFSLPTPPCFALHELEKKNRIEKMVFAEIVRLVFTSPPECMPCCLAAERASSDTLATFTASPLPTTRAAALTRVSSSFVTLHANRYTSSASAAAALRRFSCCFDNGCDERA